MKAIRNVIATEAILFAVDKPSFIESTKVLLLNSFLKKDTKQYKAEIKKAIEILKDFGND